MQSSPIRDRWISTVSKWMMLVSSMTLRMWFVPLSRKAEKSSSRLWSRKKFFTRKNKNSAEKLRTFSTFW